MKLNQTVLAMIISAAGISAQADNLACKYISSQAESANGFLTAFSAQFNCNGTLKQFIGDNVFVSCKPQFVLSEFIKKLTPGEAVKFEVSQNRVSSIDGSSQFETMVRRAVSASGKTLEPQTIIQHGMPVVCDPTQIEVR